MSGADRVPPPWGDQRIDEMTSAEKVAAMMADVDAYMAQARAEMHPKAHAEVQARLEGRIARERVVAAQRRERRRRAFWIDVGSIFDLTGERTAQRLRELREER